MFFPRKKPVVSTYTTALINLLCLLVVTSTIVFLTKRSLDSDSYSYSNCIQANISGRIRINRIRIWNHVPKDVCTLCCVIDIRPHIALKLLQVLTVMYEVWWESNVQGEISLIRSKLERFCKKGFYWDGCSLFGSFRGDRLWSAWSAVWQPKPVKPLRYHDPLQSKGWRRREFLSSLSLGLQSRQE